MRTFNQQSLRPLSRLKNLVVGGSGSVPRTCFFGLFRGLTLDLDLAFQTQVWLGLWERETYWCIRYAAERSQWAVDIGAGRGELSVYLLQQAGMETVYAFEPQVRETDVMRRNLGLNGVGEDDRVHILNDRAGTAGETGTTALDVLELDRRKVGFIKIDVDGAECDVLDSAVSLLTQAQVYLLVETHSQALERDCVERLENLGYVCAIVLNAWWRAVIPELRPIEHNRWLWAVKLDSA